MSIAELQAKSISPLFLLALLVASLWPVQSFAQGCTCKGGVLDNLNGGARDPLHWSFAVHSGGASTGIGQPIFCYYKNVENASEREVWRIRWEVAGYFREYLPPRKSTPYCADIVGNLAEAPVSGRLLFGSIASQFYETTVRRPAGGWPMAMLDRPAIVPASTEPPKSLASLTATMTVYMPEPVQISLRSSGEVEGKVAKLRYEFSNDGEVPARIYINLSGTPIIFREILGIADPLLLNSKEKKSFQVTVEEEVRAETTLVVVQTSYNKTVAIDTAAFYAPVEGQKLRSDSHIWQTLGYNALN